MVAQWEQGQRHCERAVRESAQVPNWGPDQLSDSSGCAAVFRIVGIYFDYSSVIGLVLIPIQVYRRFWNDASITAIGAYLQPGADEAQVEDSIRRAFGGENVVVQSNKALRQAALVIFDRTFAITMTLRIIAIVVAFIGVWAR